LTSARACHGIGAEGEKKKKKRTGGSRRKGRGGGKKKREGQKEAVLIICGPQAGGGRRRKKKEKKKKKRKTPSVATQTSPLGANGFREGGKSGGVSILGRDKPMASDQKSGKKKERGRTCYCCRLATNLNSRQKKEEGGKGEEETEKEKGFVR